MSDLVKQDTEADSGANFQKARVLQAPRPGKAK